MRGASGFGAVDVLVGTALGFVAVLSALTAARGILRAAEAATGAAEAAASGGWALDRLQRELERAGVGVCPGATPPCPDEALELLDDGAIGVRGDLDRDDPEAARDPELALAGVFAHVPTANDELAVYLRRSGGDSDRATSFDADLDGTDRVTLPDGTPVARRDGTVEAIACGGAAPARAAVAGTLYRVTFVNDARHAGTSRFRVSEPLLDDVVDFRVEAFDAAGAAIAACGGSDTGAARACRASARRVLLTLVLAPPRARTLVLRREVRLRSPRP